MFSILRNWCICFPVFALWSFLGILVVNIGGCSLGDRCQLMEFQRKKSIATRQKKLFPEKSVNPIRGVVLVQKTNNDFEYLSEILQLKREKTRPTHHKFQKNSEIFGVKTEQQSTTQQTQEDLAISNIPENSLKNIPEKKQRYILNRSQSDLEMSGLYAVILLNESLNRWMNHATITFEYICYGSLVPNMLHFTLDKRNVADDQQILIFLNALPEIKKKIPAWKVTLHDTQQNRLYTRKSFLWERLMKSEAKSAP